MRLRKFVEARDCLQAAIGFDGGEDLVREAMSDPALKKLWAD
jgi:hypothetical protein